jgi:phospholipid transport system transporter-binding protein
MSKKADIIFKDHVFVLTGELDFWNVMSVYEKSMQKVVELKEMTFDFTALTGSDSAGLALIIEWIKYSHHYQKSIHFKAISTDLMSIAKAAGLDQLIL